MTLNEIASVSGKPGLYKVLKPTRTGIILETIDADKKKTIANANSRVSLLKEISVYTTSEKGSVLLEEVFALIHKKKGTIIEGVSTDAELFSFLEEIVPEFDTEKVYPSDIKKIVIWYNTLVTFLPEILVEKAEDTAEEKETKVEKVAKTTKDATAQKTAKSSTPKIASSKKGGGAATVKTAKRGA